MTRCFRLASAWRTAERAFALPLALALVATLAGFAPRTAFAQKPPTAAPGSGATPAQALYKKHCQLCHLDGNAPLEPLNFVNRKWAHGSRLTDIVKVVRDGVPGTAMLAFKDLLTAEEIRAVAAHVRAFDKSLKPEKR